MKNSKKNNKNSLHKNKRHDTATDEEVAVIVDTKSGAEYYMFLIDFFKIQERSYVAMVPYEPFAVRTKESNVVILRSTINKEGDQLYMQIKKKKELEMAFEVFYKRFEEAENKEIE